MLVKCFTSAFFIVGNICFLSANCNTLFDMQKHPNNNSIQRFNLFVYSSFSYSHCLETFGAVLMLVDGGNYDATILVTGPCNALAERAQNVTRYPERLKIEYDAIPQGMMEKLGDIFTAVENSCILCDNLFELNHRPKILRHFISAGDEPLRRDNFSRAEILNRQRTFDVVMCDGFVPACFEFADRHGVVAIWIGVQGPPLPTEMAHNGLWLSACPRIGSTLSTSCSLRERLAIFVAYYYNTKLASTFMNRIVRQIFADWNGLDPRSAFGMVDAIRKIATELRVGQPNVPPLRVEYPSIDQRVIGTTVVPGYYRADHAIIGPTWLNLLHTQFDTDKHAHLIKWLERAQKPVVFVSFGTNARLSRDETRIILEGIVSEHWQTVWKITNEKFVSDILYDDDDKNNNKSKRLDARVRRVLTLNADALQLFDWAPQLALLRHPKVKAFVTHGGLSSTMEACASAVPMVCVPLFGDQPVHCAQLAAVGIAIRLLKYDVTATSLNAAISRLLFGDNNNSNTAQHFAQRAQRIARYHSRVDTARRLDEFVSHYAEFKYEFMETSSDYYNWHTYWGVDFMAVIVLLLAATLATSLLAMWLVRRIVFHFYVFKTKQSLPLDAAEDLQTKSVKLQETSTNKSGMVQRRRRSLLVSTVAKAN